MSFDTNSFRIAIVPYGSSGDVSFDHSFDWFLDEPLFEADKLPKLNSAPSSSWFIARLRALDELIPGEITEHNDGGGYYIDVAVASGTSLVAAFQIQGDMEGVLAHGTATDAETADRILEEFVQTLVDDSDNVAESCYRIADPDWMMDPDSFVPTPNEDSANEYGWRDNAYLGAHNIREK